jgi:hypothetical protein
VIGWCVGIFGVQSFWPGLVATAALYLPLSILGYLPPMLPGAKNVRFLTRLAVGCGVFALLGGIFASPAADRFIAGLAAMPRIALAPTPDRPGYYRISGLRVRWGPDLRKSPPGAGHAFSGDMSRAGGATGITVFERRPPLRVNDGYGNHVAFRVVRPNVLRIEDNLGGFMEIDWNRDVPVVTDSQPASQATRAGMPTAIGGRLVGLGQWLMIVTPLTSWLLLIAAVRAVFREGDVYLQFTVPWILQLVGLGLFMLMGFVQWSYGSRSGEAGIAAAVMVLVIGAPALSASISGAFWTAWLLLRHSGELEAVWRSDPV